MKFWHREQFDANELERLADQLRTVGKVMLPPKKQQSLKRQLFTSIEQGKLESGLLPQSLRVLGSQMSEVGEKVALTVPERVRMKERIFSFIQKSNWMGFRFGLLHSPRFLRAALSSAMLLFFVVSSVLVFPFQVPLTYAARLTYIEEVSGQVFVLRSGKLIDAKKDFSLEEGDILITNAESYVTVRFFDDSVSRLDANTQLEVKRLYSEPFNPVATQVELMLEEGHVWTRVLNLIDENSHFMVSTQSTAAIVTKKAAFDLQTHVYTTTLSVFDNVVDFAMGANYSSETRSVLAGFQAQVSQENGSNVTKIVPFAEGLRGNKTVARWVESNLEKDKVHTAALVQESQKALEDTSGAASVLQSSEDVENVENFSNQDIEQERLNFVDAYNRLLLGETYLMRQQGREGMQLVMEFESTVRSIMIRYPGYKKQDPLNANLLLSYIQSRVEQQRKDFSTLLPGDSLYPVKEELENVELLLTGSDVDKAKMQLSQSEDKLLEVQDLVGKSKFEQAQAVLVRYQRQIDNLVLKVNSENTSELHDKLVSLFDQQVEQIKVLTSIEKSLVVTQPDLLQQVRDLRQKVLEKLVVALEKVDVELPLSLIQELRDLLQTYVDNGTYDDTFVGLLNKMLTKYGKEVSGGVEGKLPSELGMVTIVEEDATRAVHAQTTQQKVPVPKKTVTGGCQTAMQQCTQEVKN